jgi:hypothetical protein
VDKNKPSPSPTKDAENELAEKEHRSARPDADLDAIWRVAIGLDLGERSVFEAEVLMWRICKAKSMPHDAILRALNEDWEGD